MLVIDKACKMHSKQHSWKLSERLKRHSEKKIEHLFEKSPPKLAARYPKLSCIFERTVIYVIFSKSPFIVSLRPISRIFPLLQNPSYLFELVKLPFFRNRSLFFVILTVIPLLLTVPLEVKPTVKRIVDPRIVDFLNPC